MAGHVRHISLHRAIVPILNVVGVSITWPPADHAAGRCQTRLAFTAGTGVVDARDVCGADYGIEYFDFVDAALKEEIAITGNFDGCVRVGRNRVHRRVSWIRGCITVIAVEINLNLLSCRIEGAGDVGPNTRWHRSGRRVRREGVVERTRVLDAPLDLACRQYP